LIVSAPVVRNIESRERTTLAAKAASTTGAAGALRGLVHANGATVEPTRQAVRKWAVSFVYQQICSLDVIHARDGSIGLGVLAEANETEATAATGVAVLDDDLRLLVDGALG
jgi:hypothetical protein